MFFFCFLVLFCLAITIEKCPARVYRQLEVPSNIRLGHLAKIIIGIIGWFGGHMYQFTKERSCFVPPEVFEKESGGCPPEDCGGVWGYAEMLESGECEPEEFELEEGQAMVENYVDMVSLPDYRYGSLREDLFGF